jgi:hypothetical protein
MVRTWLQRLGAKWFAGETRTRGADQPPVRLSVERLEERDTPSVYAFWNGQWQYFRISNGYLQSNNGSGWVNQDANVQAFGITTEAGYSGNWLIEWKLNGNVKDEVSPHSWYLEDTGVTQFLVGPSTGNVWSLDNAGYLVNWTQMEQWSPIEAFGMNYGYGTVWAAISPSGYVITLQGG